MYDHIHKDRVKQPATDVSQGDYTHAQCFNCCPYTDDSKVFFCSSDFSNCNIEMLSEHLHRDVLQDPQIQDELRCCFV